MTFREYSDELRNYHFHPLDLSTIYDYFSLSQTIGQISEKMKAMLESSESMSEIDKQKMAISLGDIIMWATFMIFDMGLNIDDTIELNLKKCLLMKKKLMEQNNK